jgi:hypothetical protein
MSGSYYEIFMKQFVQTLAQLTAAAVTTSVAVPLYNFYVRRNNLYQNTYEVNQEEDQEEDQENDDQENDQENDQANEADEEDNSCDNSSSED